MKWYILLTFVLTFLLFTGCQESSSSYKATVKPLKVRAVQQDSYVPTNARLYLDFSKTLDTATINSESVSLLSENEKVEILITINDKRLTVTPQSYLKANHSYRLVVSEAVADIEGEHLIEPYIWEFNTAEHVDLIAPEALALLPKEGSTSVSIESEIAILFNEPLSLESVDLTSVVVTVQETNESIDGEISVEHDIVRFAPSASLQSATQYSVTVSNNLSDLYGNSLESTIVWNFTTNSDSDAQQIASKTRHSLNLNSSLYSMHEVGEYFVFGGENQLLSLFVDPVTCKTETKDILDLTSDIFAISSEADRIFFATQDGVYEVGFEAGAFEEVIQVVETQYPVYDLALKNNMLYIAKSLGGVSVFDIASSEETTLSEGVVSDVFATQNGYVGVDNVNHEWIVNDNTEQKYPLTINLYDIASESYEVAAGISGLGDMQDNIFSESYVPRSFVSNITLFNYNNQNFLVANDRNRGLILKNPDQSYHYFSQKKEGMIRVGNLGECLILAYEDGALQSIDVLPPYVTSTTPDSDASLSSPNQSITLQWNEALDADTNLQEYVSVSDEAGSVIPISIDLNITVLRITPQENLINKSVYKLQITQMYDLYGNNILNPITLEFATLFTDNTAPEAKDDTAELNEDTSIVIDILQNDIDYDGDELNSTSVSVVEEPLNGKLFIDDSGMANYTPNADYNGTDMFSYRVEDEHGLESNTAVVSIIVNNLNDAPVAVDDSVTIDEDTTVDIAVLENDYDPDGNETNVASVVIRTYPKNGSIYVNDSGIVTYIPESDYYGTDGFTYTVEDNSGALSNIASVSITINNVIDAPLNNAPVANNDSETYFATLSLIDILANDSDSDGSIDPTTVEITQYPSVGTITVNPSTGVVAYDAGVITSGLLDTFRYTVKDNEGAVSNEAIVTVTTP